MCVEGFHFGSRPEVVIALYNEALSLTFKGCPRCKLGRKRKCPEARANQLCHFFKRCSCTAGSFCSKSHAAAASKKGIQQGGVDASLMLECEPMLNEESVYNGWEECSVRSAPSANHGGHQKKYTRSYDIPQAPDTYALPFTVARSVLRPTRSSALAREELHTVPRFPFAS